MQTTQRKAESDVGEMDGHGLSLLVFMEELQLDAPDTVPIPQDVALVQYGFPHKPYFSEHYEA